MTNPRSFQEVLSSDFILLSFYHEATEANLKRVYHKVEERLRESLGENETVEKVNPFAAFEFPRYARYSFVSLLASLVETKLEDFCRELERRKGATGGPRYDAHKKSVKNPSNFIKAKRFIDLHLYRPVPNEQGQRDAMDAIWESDIEFLQACRNCIMHAGGKVSALKRSQGDQQKLKAAVGQWEGYAIQNDRLFFDEASCLQLFQRSQRFFNSLICLLAP